MSINWAFHSFGVRNNKLGYSWITLIGCIGVKDYSQYVRVLDSQYTMGQFFSCLIVAFRKGVGLQTVKSPAMECECLIKDILLYFSNAKLTMNFDLTKSQPSILKLLIILIVKTFSFYRYTKQGSLKYHTDCAPNNGYYLIPLYDKGDYVLKIEPPAGWSFEPSSVPLHVDGKSDPCSLNHDINFNFKGFTITGQVLFSWLYFVWSAQCRFPMFFNKILFCKTVVPSGLMFSFLSEKMWLLIENYWSHLNSIRIENGIG